MIKKLRQIIYRLLKKSEKFFQTDMIYLAKGGFWLFINKAVSASSSFILALVFASLLPKESYGIYKYVLSIAAILSISVLPGINTALTIAIAKKREGLIKTAILTKFKWAIIGGLIAIFISGYYFYNGNSTLGISFLIIAFVNTFIDALIVYGPYLKGKKKFKTLSIYNSTHEILVSSALIICLFLTKSPVLIILTYFLSKSIIQIFFSIFTFKKNKLNNVTDKETISYGKHLSFMNVIGMIAEHLDKILIWHLLGPAQLAIYAFAIAPVTQLKTINSVLESLIFPKLSVSKITKLKASIPKKGFKLFIIASIIVFAYIIAAPFIYKIFFPAYTESIIFSQIFSLTLLFFPTMLFTQTLLTHMKKRQLYILKTLTPIFRIILVVILLPLYGIWGAIFAVLLKKIFNFILTFFLFKNATSEEY
jgi:O-antigen/teichoic acid export membrane protein